MLPTLTECVFPDRYDLNQPSDLYLYSQSFLFLELVLFFLLELLLLLEKFKE